MKTYAPVDILRARENAGRPVDDFIASKVLENIIDGIINKYGFSGEDIRLINILIVTTIVGLEPVSALETNTHQCFPHLSNEKTRELVADIQDRVLKEAKRRSDENITDPARNWNEVAWGKKPTVDELEALKKRFHEETQRGLSVEEITRLAQEDARKQQEQEALEEAEYIAKKKARGETILSEEEGTGTETGVPSQKIPVTTVTKPVPPPSNTVVPAPPSIASQKLVVPSAQQSVRAEVSAIQGPLQTSSNPEPEKERLPVITERKPDVYREPID